MDHKKKDIIKHFGSIFRNKDLSGSEVIPESEYVGYMDPSNVCLVIPKRKGFKDFLLTNFDLIDNAKIPSLDYMDITKGIANKCIYSCEYLKVLLELTKHYETVTLSIKGDYPLKAETEDFIFILAPRVGND